jgi:hypothetical protein
MRSRILYPAAKKRMILLLHVSFYLRLVYIGEISATMTANLLVSATLGGMAHRICLALPGVAKTRSEVTVMCCCRWHFRLSVHAKLRQWKYGFRDTKFLRFIW